MWLSDFNKQDLPARGRMKFGLCNANSTNIYIELNKM